MPLLTSVLLKMGVSQPLQRFIHELLVLLLIVPGWESILMRMTDRWD